jgi:hypothetical protein
MYIWRGKNRRDKRNLLLLGEAAWTATAEDKCTTLEDEILRCEKEKQHVDYFVNNTKNLITEYLYTEDGSLEIDLLRREIERERRNELAEVDEMETMKTGIYDIYKDFTLEEGCDDIDREGLKDLLSHLNMTVSEKQFNQYLQKLNFTTEKETISFEEFYTGI